MALPYNRPNSRRGSKKNARGKYKTRADKKFCNSKGGVKDKGKGLYHYHNRVKPAKNRL